MNIKYKVLKEHFYFDRGADQMDVVGIKEFYDVNLAIECYKKWVEESKTKKPSYGEWGFEITVHFDGMEGL